MGLFPDLSGYGFFDTVATTGSEIAMGKTLGGFTAQVNFLGTGTPGSQIFQVVDANTFATLDQGTTVLAVIASHQAPVDVPEPQTWLLFFAGLLAAAAIRQKSKGA